MSIGNALSFVKRGQVDALLRDRLNSTACSSELHAVLSEERLTFSPYEFEDALNSLLVKCQTFDEANQLKAFQTWWQMLQDINGIELCSQKCSGGCSK